MPNLTDVLNSIFGDVKGANKTFADLIGGIIGLGADLSGASGFIDQLINAGQPGLDRILQAIQNGFTLLGKQNQAQQILDRNTTLNGYIAGARTQLDSLKAEMAAHPSAVEVVNFIKPCIDALNNFEGTAQPDIVWNLTAGWPIYWSDDGVVLTTSCPQNPEVQVVVNYGPQNPAPNPDGLTVLYYGYSFPLYLFAIAILLTVGGSLDPNFPVNYADVFEGPDGVLSVLTSRYQQILGGITQLSPPDWTSAIGIAVACGYKGLVWVPPGPDTTGRALVEYGFLEKFSGYSSMGGGTLDAFGYALSLDAQNRAQDGTYAKLLVRLLKRKKDVYIGVGLQSVIQTINSLNRLFRNPAVPDLANWSLREVVALAQLPSMNRGSLRALATFLVGTEPYDTPYATTSATVTLRTLLTNFPN